MGDNFCKNLRLLCSYYKSIAEVCRLVPINRSQFNKYLNGTSTPSKYILRRICDFFGVEEYEIFLPHNQFAQIIQVRPNTTNQPQNRQFSRHIEQLQAHGQNRFDQYLGYYFEIYYSMAFPGNILRNLVELTRVQGEVVYRRVERLKPPGGGRTFHARYLGCAFFLSERIFMVDYESLTGNEVTQTILYPTYKSRISRLSGLRLGVSDSAQRDPACVRVAYDYLGQQVDLRKALRMCGLYPADSPMFDQSLKDLIDNRSNSSDNLFLAATV
ncbi:XRE family transcriptional regulator [Motiliproteus sp.]|uniref:XRE family transcriptional regulator n=1 Tax=Motiliproteus sp. TaxID=1898955 RepID=UPI003BAA324C